MELLNSQYYIMEHIIQKHLFLLPQWMGSSTYVQHKWRELTAIPGNGRVNGTCLMLMLWIPSSWSFILRKCPDPLSSFSNSWNRLSLLESLSCQYMEIFTRLPGRCCQNFPDLGKISFSSSLAGTNEDSWQYVITTMKYMINLVTNLFLGLPRWSIALNFMSTICYTICITFLIETHIPVRKDLPSHRMLEKFMNLHHS